MGAAGAARIRAGDTSWQAIQHFRRGFFICGFAAKKIFDYAWKSTRRYRIMPCTPLGVKFQNAISTNLPVRALEMNVIFVEPAFPNNQREFVRGLVQSGATVVAIGESSKDSLDGQLRDWLYDYIQVPSVCEGSVRF